MTTRIKGFSEYYHSVPVEKIARKLEEQNSALGEKQGQGVVFVEKNEKPDSAFRITS